jgi:uncharacterized membrane protein
MPDRVTAREGIQYVSSLEIEIPYNGVNPENGVGLETVATHTLPVGMLPAGARVTGGEIVNDVQAVGPTVATISLGIVGATTKYLSAVNRLSAAGTRTALTLTGEQHANAVQLIATIINTVAVATAGKVWLRVEYVAQSRIHENIG